MFRIGQNGLFFFSFNRISNNLFIYLLAITGIIVPVLRTPPTHFSQLPRHIPLLSHSLIGPDMHRSVFLSHTHTHIHRLIVAFLRSSHPKGGSHSPTFTCASARTSQTTVTRSLGWSASCFYCCCSVPMCECVCVLPSACCCCGRRRRRRVRSRFAKSALCRPLRCDALSVFYAQHTRTLARVCVCICEVGAHFFFAHTASSSLRSRLSPLSRVVHRRTVARTVVDNNCNAGPHNTIQSFSSVPKRVCGRQTAKPPNTSALDRYTFHSQSATPRKHGLPISVWPNGCRVLY